MEEPRAHRQSARKFARAARVRMTKGEEFLWQVLRRNGVGASFRRQIPIGPYFADFACPAARVIVEVDGRTHHSAEARVKDAARQAWLGQQGWRVLRYQDDWIIGGGAVEVAIRAAVAEGLRSRDRSKQD